MATGKDKKRTGKSERKGASTGQAIKMEVADVTESSITSEENEAYNTKSYLMFKVQDSMYAINVENVQQIVWLPEVTPIAESPDYIIGAINYRGEILTVMDLDIRLGYTPRHYRPTDNILVIQQEGVSMGVIVNEVLNVYDISREEFESSPSYGQIGKPRSHFMSGMAKIEGDIIMVIDCRDLIQHSEPIDARIRDDILRDLESEKEHGTKFEALKTWHHSFCPDATQEEMEIYRKRANELMRPFDDQESTRLIPMAVVDLSGEYYGVALDAVCEFYEINNLAYVPGCPDHIIGNMNVRGDIITLVDIRGTLNMPVKSSELGDYAVIVQIGDIIAGITVDKIFDMIFINQADMNPVPAAVQSIGEEYLKGTVHYKDIIVSILDIKKIMTDKRFSVYEEI